MIPANTLNGESPSARIPAAAGWRRDTAHLVLATIALNMLSLALPIMTLQVYDRVLPNPESGTLVVLMAGVVLAILLETCLRLARAWMMGWNGAVYEQSLATQAMQRILSADVSRATGGGGIGAFLHRITAITRIKDFYSGYVMVTLTELAFIPVFLGLILYIAAPLAVIPLLLLGIFVCVSALQGRRMQRELEDRDAQDDARYDYLIKVLDGIHSVKSFALENLLTRKYETLQEKSGLASFRAAEASTSAFNFGTMLSHIMMACIITAGALFVVSGHVTTGALIATLQLSGRLMQPAQRGLVLWARYQDFILSRRKVDSLFRLPQHKTRSDSSSTPTAASEGRLTIRDAAFASVLRGVSLDIAPGDVVVINGAAGSGKSALLEMAAGLYPPDHGRIQIDGVDIDLYNPEDLSRRVGYLGPEGMIFRGSIRDNLTRFGTLADSTVRDVAHWLKIDRDVARLPGGFDTMMQGNESDQVPPGLRQRIAIARTLAARPKIILFDEADRGLDRDGYNLVFSLLARLTRQTAMLIVSDDANITALATRRYLLRDGKLMEQTPLPERKPVA